MSNNTANTGHLTIWSVLLLALFLRTLLPIAGYSYTRDATIFYTPDSASYIVPARELIAYHRCFSDGSPQARVWNWPVVPAPEIIRTPGYPLLLTVGLLFGRLEVVTIALQILLGCFTVYMVYRTAALLFDSERIALIAAMLYAIEPLSVLFSSLLSTETLFTAILMVGVYYFVRYLRRRSLADLLVSSAALAISVYVRPAGYFLPLIIAGGLLVWALVTAQPNKPRMMAHLSVFLIAFVGLTGLWRVRNQIEIGYSGFSSVFSEDMYCCVAASVLAAKRHLSYSDMQDRLGCFDLGTYFQGRPERKTWPRAQVVNFMSRDAEQILLGSPLTYAQIYLEGVVRGIFDPGSTEFLRFFDLYPKDGGLLELEVDKGIIKTLGALLHNTLLAWSTFLLLALQFVYLLGAGRIAFSRRLTRDPAIVLTLVIVSYYLAVPGGPTDWGRFRHPAMPILCMLAGYGLHVVQTRS